MGKAPCSKQSGEEVVGIWEAGKNLEPAQSDAAEKTSEQVVYEKLHRL